MSELVDRLRNSDGFRVFTAGDGGRSICADTDLMREAADRIAELETEVANPKGARGACGCVCVLCTPVVGVKLPGYEDDGL